jgi:hypothetical protein
MRWELTKELEDKILSQLEMGISLVKICAEKDMPSRRTVLYWQRDNLDFCTKCAHAREAAGDLAADKHNDVIDGCLEGTIPPDVAGRVLSGLQWRASKLASKKYGDKQSVDVDVTSKGQSIAPLSKLSELVAKINVSDA